MTQNRNLFGKKSPRINVVYSQERRIFLSKRRNLILDLLIKYCICSNICRDHAGGNEKLVSKFNKSLKVYGGDDRIGALTDKVKQDDEIRLGNLTIRCLFTPCHTTGHICYYIDSPNGERAVFTGDTLFLGGCGRFFEGNATDMHAALIGKLSALPNDTNVYCGHEYTLQNLAFAKHVEPNNQDIVKKIEWSKKMRTDNIPTVNEFIFCYLRMKFG